MWKHTIEGMGVVINEGNEGATHQNPPPSSMHTKDNFNVIES